MKVYISADIEGVTGIAHWDEATEGHAAYAEFRERMNDEVVAACEGALAGGAREILVKDAHSTGRNLFADRLPREARLIRGWSGHPASMVQELDESFDALVLVGYHAPAGSGGNPLSHTMSSSAISRMTINGEPVAEFHLFAFAAADLGVPTVFVSGDAELCAQVGALNAGIATVASMRGVGDSTVGEHPHAVREEIRAEVERAVGGDLSTCALVLPQRFVLEIEYHKPSRAYRAGFYPGATQVDDRTVRFETECYFEVLRTLNFLV